MFCPKCEACGAAVAIICLYRDADDWRLTYNGPGGSNAGGDSISAERAHAIIAAFSQPATPASLKAASFHDDAGFCGQCAKFYCAKDWNISSTGGGTCPSGHFKSLDPHWSPE